MDANERLRRYLEQRREVGESELVLDGLPVEDVLAMLGVKKGGAPRSEPRGETRTEPRPTRPAPPPIEYTPPPDQSESLVPQPPMSAAPPPEPAVRFDANAPSDWRQILGSSSPDAPKTGDAPASRAVTPSAPSPETKVPAASKPIAPSQGGAASIAAASEPLPAWLEAVGLPVGLSVGSAAVARDDAASGLVSLDAIADAVRACSACALHKSATNAVPGEGDPHADFLCVGEAPGANEDQQGRPFVGEAGQLLTKILGAIHLQREQVYICNVLKHRPPGNRDPMPEEVHACQPYLLRQLELVKPRVILALGRFAAQTLLQTTTSIGQLRGQLHRFHGIPLIVTYHPAALLRNESWKRPTWEDVKLARRVLDASHANVPRVGPRSEPRSEPRVEPRVEG